MNVLIKVENLTATYPGQSETKVLCGVNLTVQPGEFIAIVGKIGTGKSTLVKHFNALHLPTSGKVYVDGYETSDEQNLPYIRQTVGMVFQNPDNQLIAAEVEEEIYFGLQNLGFPEAEIIERANRTLETFDLTKIRKYPPHRLSGGQKQRVAIASIFAMQPRCLVLDEPTGMLDPESRSKILELVRWLHVEKRVTIILITHRTQEMLLADRIIGIDSGQIQFDRKKSEFLRDLSLFETFDLLPTPTHRLAKGLENLGVKMDEFPLTPGEMVETLCRLKRAN